MNDLKTVQPILILVHRLHVDLYIDLYTHYHVVNGTSGRYRSFDRSWRYGSCGGARSAGAAGGMGARGAMGAAVGTAHDMVS